MMKWISAGDIKSWVTSNRRDCEARLPELVRRLILATADVDAINFPAGDNINSSGWDGNVETRTSRSPFCPTGTSGWEMGVGGSITKKANKDYEKRTKDPLGLRTEDTTFVFVTPNPWSSHHKWEIEKREKKDWKDVRSINVDNLELWLESAPAVALWLARMLGRGSSTGIRDIEAIWNEWSRETKPHLTTELVIGGRANDVSRIQEWIAGKPCVLSVQGDSPDETRALLYSSISALPDNDRLTALSRCVAVETTSDFRDLQQFYQDQPLIIVAPSECSALASSAAEDGHYVFLSMDSSVFSMGPFLRLSRPRREQVEESLMQSGMSNSKARQFARDLGCSIPVLRRHLSPSATRTPQWANSQSANYLIPAMLAGAWSEDSEGDRNAVETLSGMEYDALIAGLVPLSSMDDAPVRKIGSMWIIKSPLDALFLLGQHPAQNQLQRFHRVIVSVLMSMNPKYDLLPEQRWAADIYNKGMQHTGWLRTGLAESLVLVSVFGSRTQIGVSTQAFVNSVVKEILPSGDKWEAWASINDVTTLIAEAAPSTFLDAIGESINNYPVVFQELMLDDGSTFSECRHSGLLWAVEAIAWDADYFAQAADVLFELAGLDKGGRWGNRPISSLSGLFRPRLPQTYATPEARLATLDKLIMRDTRLIWRCVESYFSPGVFFAAHRYRWRYAGGERGGLEQEDLKSIREYGAGLEQRLVALACSKENMIAALGEFNQFPLHIQRQFLKALEKADPKCFSRDERIQMTGVLRNELHRISNHSDSYSPLQLPILKRVLKRLMPVDILDRLGWLLNNPWPRLPQREPKEHTAREAFRRKAQERAAREILDKCALRKIISFACKADYPGFVAYVLGRVVRGANEDVKVLTAVLKHNKDMPMLARGYAQGRIEIAGRKWIDRQISRMKAKGDCSSLKCSLLFLGLPEGRETWEAVTAHGKRVEKAYWTRATGYSRSDRSSDTLIAVRHLLDVERPGTALELAGNPDISLPSSMLVELLRKLYKKLAEDNGLLKETMSVFYLGHVFKQLYESNEYSLKEIAMLEWPLAPLFEEIGTYSSRPMALHRLLQQDPAFFAQLISYTAKRDAHPTKYDSADIDEKGLENRRRIAHEILNSWCLLPGLDECGMLDEDKLNEWVESARRMYSEAGYLKEGDIQLAFILANGPCDADGTWPGVAIRNLIERLNNKLIDDHIRLAVRNGRGVVSRSLDEGGKQERELAAKYASWCEAVKAKWPRTAAILRRLAESYDREGQSEDIESDLHDLLWR